MQVKEFTFNPFQENTYILYDDTKQAVIIDPGCYNPQERKAITDFISQNELKLVMLLNTHCHIDHVFGNAFISKQYEVPFLMHQMDLATLHAVPGYAPQWGFTVDELPEPTKFVEEGEIIQFGNTKLHVLFTPGHSAGSVSFYSPEDQTLIAGDVLFRGSIGRTDLPGGDYETLIHSIKSKLLPLGDDVKVYSGHGPMTTIGFERVYNPFLNE